LKGRAHENLISKFDASGALLLSVCCLIVFLVAAGSASNRQQSLLNHVLSSSYTVLAVNWKTVSKDPDLKRISKGAEVEKLFAQLGLDADTVAEPMLAGS
jgi:hypothetical protein